MKTLLAVAFAATLCLAAGCASRGASSADGGNSAGSSSGITVFGTIDANVSNVKNRSR
ncbi:hypothetical protein [Variovorax saccharolyticus]|uniref:hypothetical protein n=1 Tax=Variovorax saccharolyticus TaxID=3053516 RepID=UPI002578C5A7|nr:hypothetical protein [Variovorax sp. J31P216]MDM0027685.1 hypothetical protein [Variovorax sp. J31P216]